MTPPPERPPQRTAPVVRARVEGHESRLLSDGWQAAHCAADLHNDAAALDELGWSEARVPGTAAAALQDAGARWLGDGVDLDGEDWWFRTSFDAGPSAPDEQLHLCLDGVATVAEIYLNGELVLESESMFAAHALELGGRLRERNELAIRCRALGPLLSVRRRPRARWRTRLVGHGNLRFFRTMLLGRCPGIAPGPAAVGPWRPVRLERRRRIDLEQLALRPRMQGTAGMLEAQVCVRALDGGQPRSIVIELSGPSGTHRMQLKPIDRQDADGHHLAARGVLPVPNVARWWPHTHGEPTLHDVRLQVDDGERPTIEIDAGQVGFRELAFGARADHEVERDGLDLHVNGVRVFARGAVWTPIDPISLAPSQEQLRAELTRVREAGMNMLRLPGTGAYESAVFHDLCDELGILVWQDFMFANLDYPIADERFHEAVEREAAGVLAALGGRPSLAVLCGNSEVEQQAAMMGLDQALGRGELFGELLPARVRDSGVDCLYVPSAPCGGDVPFRTDRGIATYYGVGCYRLPLEDVRRAGVRFAAECLAFSHVPGEAALEAMAPAAPERLLGNHPTWKAGIPRENGADWDFEDVRDQYLRMLFGVDAAELRPVDHERYLELSRALTGELLGEVYGEWRRSSSPCGGALVLWLRDLLPGAGWGVIDSHGAPKLAYHHLRRALAPVAVWTTDEQLGGIVAHVANDRPQPLDAWLRVALYREREHLLEQARAPVQLAAHGAGEWNVEAVLGHFVDAGWTYRFGPPAQDAVVVTLEHDPPGDAGAAHGAPAAAGEVPRPTIGAQAFRFPAGRPLERERPEQLGLRADALVRADGNAELRVCSRRLAYGVQIHVPGYRPDDDGFSVEPGGERIVTLLPAGGTGAPPPNAGDTKPGANRSGFGTLGALNMSGRLRITLG